MKPASVASTAWDGAPVVQPSEASQAAVTLGNTDNEIGGLTISAAYSQVEVQALRDKCEELADDVQALSTLVHALRAALVNAGVVRAGGLQRRDRAEELANEVRAVAALVDALRTTLGGAGVAKGGA